MMPCQKDFQTNVKHNFADIQFVTRRLYCTLQCVLINLDVYERTQKNDI
jgi:hypothetical protein